MLKADIKRCNLCGQDLDFWDLQEEFIIHKETLGYGTAHDGDAMSLQLCCKCMDRIINACLLSPIIDRTE